MLSRHTSLLCSLCFCWLFNKLLLFDKITALTTPRVAKTNTWLFRGREIFRSTSVPLIPPDLRTRTRGSSPGPWSVSLNVKLDIYQGGGVVARKDSAEKIKTSRTHLSGLNAAFTAAGNWEVSAVQTPVLLVWWLFFIPLMMILTVCA